MCGRAPCAALLLVLSVRILGLASNSDLDTVSHFKLQSFLLDSSRFLHHDVADGREKSVTAGVVSPLGSPVCCGPPMVWSAQHVLQSCLSTVMKGSNAMPVFVLSCTWGLQLSTRVRFVNIAWIPAGALMPVSEQVRFVMTGFVFLLDSQFGECGKTSWKIGWMKSHLKPDALTCSMFPSSMLHCVDGWCRGDAEG